MTESTAESTFVLLAGATGMLGAKIANELLMLPTVRLRLLARSDARQDPPKKATLDALVAGGATIVEGDLAHRATLEDDLIAGTWNE